MVKKKATAASKAAAKEEKKSHGCKPKLTAPSTSCPCSKRSMSYVTQSTVKTSPPENETENEGGPYNDVNINMQAPTKEVGNNGKFVFMTETI